MFKNKDAIFLFPSVRMKDNSLRGQTPSFFLSAEYNYIKVMSCSVQRALMCLPETDSPLTFPE